jgi:hypothetical protein
MTSTAGTTPGTRLDRETRPRWLAASAGRWGTLFPHRSGPRWIHALSQNGNSAGNGRSQLHKPKTSVRSEAASHLPLRGPRLSAKPVRLHLGGSRKPHRNDIVSLPVVVHTSSVSESPRPDAMAARRDRNQQREAPEPCHAPPPITRSTGVVRIFPDCEALPWPSRNDLCRPPNDWC